MSDFKILLSNCLECKELEWCSYRLHCNSGICPFFTPTLKTKFKRLKHKLRKFFYKTKREKLLDSVFKKIMKDLEENTIDELIKGIN